MIKNRITTTDAATALAQLTSNIGSTFLQSVFPEAAFPNAERVNQELLFLSMYIIDGLIKNPAQESWQKHREPLAKHYYSKCTILAGQHLDGFMTLFLERITFYNEALSKHISLANLKNRDDRLVAVGALAGKYFAEICGQPDDDRHKLIGAGAFTTINLSTEQLFFQSEIIGE